MARAIWAKAIGREPEAMLKRLLAEAPLCGLSLDVLSEPVEDSAALLVFDPDDPGSLTAVQDVCREGRRQILGIAAGRAAEDGSADWRFLQAGLTDIWHAKGPSADLAADLCRRIKMRLERMTQLDAVLKSERVTRNLVGSSGVWTDALRRVAEAALFGTLPILLTGESGTGKELCARFVKSLSGDRSGGDLITVDCTTLNPELSGSELFGHDRGAFTGAVGMRRGAFALANRGVLFLDEIGELDRLLQVQLLRAIQEKRFKRVGSNEWVQSDFRLVCATNRDLAQEVADGSFRADLYHRIAGCTIRLPPLRDRRGDVLPLARHFLAACLGEEGAVEIEPSVATLLTEREYPGNVRELQQIVQRLALRYPGAGPVTPGMVPAELRPTHDCATEAPEACEFARAADGALAAHMSLKDIAREATDAAVRLALSRCDGNVSAAAKLLSVTPRALQLRQAQQSGSESH
ncbi:sigma 54-interacting transcriptional regulator [Palleronia pelagia]|uniref:Nif-specific regulatory protein n=1 Tax=Palleronia pelagia TaxID=387096 RepID=A0A1H8LC43_9RHOB|nr:sigma 54-interacting transcriptional regulator [Palleronia pelagia]SEO02740.1 DNA-binding transcriptional response regulator, NtrC family, contains REC, AAA-type ATPase, and a Fis-type DNA-binding domains [Palleronia pelagia]